jgi:GT2 family glycosyltransferase
MDLSIVVVNWHSRDYLHKCIASILTHTRDIAYEIIVIDSASFDGCDRMLREEYPQVRFLQSATNVGFAKANNCAFQESHGDCLLFLNPDTKLVGPAINTLYEYLQSLPDAGALGCRLLNSNGTLQSTCIRAIPTVLNRILDSELLRTRWRRSRLWGMAPLYEEGTAAKEAEAISGACLMVKRSVFEKVGRFSEDYFMYAEDMDLSYKIRSAGYRNYYVPAATVVHYGGSSSEHTPTPFSAVMMPEATWRFLRKTGGPLHGLAYRLGMCASAVLRLLLLAVGSRLRPGERQNQTWQTSSRKWRSVLRWSLNRDMLVRQYYPRVRRRSFLG